MCDTTWNCMSLCNCSHQFCKNIPVSFDFITTWNQWLFLCSPCTSHHEEPWQVAVRIPEFLFCTLMDIASPPGWCPQGTNGGYPLDRKLGESHSRSGRSKTEKKISSFCRALIKDPWSPARSQVTPRTALAMPVFSALIRGIWEQHHEHSMRATCHNFSTSNFGCREKLWYSYT